MIDESRIQILQVPDCPLAGRLIDEVESCLTEMGIHEPVEVIVGEHPSPTLVIDGLDVATDAPVAGEPRCRLDVPTRDQIRAAARTLLSE